MLRTVMFITVGLSLLDKVRSEKTRNHLGIYQQGNKPSASFPNDEELLYGIKDYCREGCSSLLENMDSSELRNVNLLSAEIESLCFWLETVKEREILLEKIFLLPTNTAKSVACAEGIKHIILNAVLESRLIKNSRVQLGADVHNISLSPFDLDVGDETQFPQDVADFMAMFETKIADLDAAGVEYKVLNITGGYKVFVSMFSLFGFLRDDVEIIYKHENTEKLLSIPSLPLSWDFKLFDEYRALIHRDRDSLNFEPPSKLAALFQRQDNLWTKNAFGRILEDIYDRDKLKRFGAGARLVRFLSPDLQQALNEHVSRWDHLWMGDQIPETVEHSRGHSTRLLEYASDLLEPHIRSEPDFLNGEELYLLMCCLWLHDVGHTALTYDFELENGDIVMVPVGMFPTLVRRWHSLLSYKLLSAGDYLNPGERNAVALISKYHRGRFPLTSSQSPYSDKQFPIAIEPMEEQLDESLSFLGKEIPVNRLLLLSALLRVVDGCDVQSDRIINEVYWKVRTERTRVEVDYLFHLFENKLGLLELCDHYNTEIADLVQLLNDCRDKWNEVSIAEPEAQWRRAEDVEEFIDNSIEGPLFSIVAEICFRKDLDKAEREILLEILSLLDRIAFKMRQQAHFYKHSRVKLVYLTMIDQQHRFNMIFDEEAKLTPGQEKKLAAGIWQEYQAVEAIIADNGILFEGVFSKGDKIYPCDGG